MRMNVLRHALLVTMLATTAAWGTPKTDRSIERKPLANRIASQLAKQDSAAVANSLHYPPSYTASEREQDVADVKKSFEFLFSLFGTVSNVKPHHLPVDSYELTFSGGLLPYWESLSPIDSVDFVYTAHFDKAGPGIIKIILFQHPSFAAPQVWRAGFGLIADRTDAKQFIIQTFQQHSVLMGDPLPPELLKQLENMPPVKSSPSSEE